MAPHSSSGYAAGTLGMAALLTVLTSSQGLLTTASKRDGSYEYNFATVPFLAEGVKFLISYHLLRRQKATDPKAARCTTQLKTVALFLVPSLIYMLHNNVQVRKMNKGGEGAQQYVGHPRAGWSEGRLLSSCDTTTHHPLHSRSPTPPRLQFYFLKYVDPATYQILGNLKIITTGVLFRVFLRRQLSLLQWIALFLLAVGATTSQINTDCSSAAKSLMSAPLAVG